MPLSIETLQQRLEQSIKEIEFNQEPATLFDPISYILSIGGKRVRPLLTLLTHSLYCDDVTKAVKPAIGIEIFHNFTLLHDDLMDQSDMRRGHLAVHKKWNDNTAILSGDAMLIEAYRYIAQVDKELLPEVLNLFSDTAMDVCSGQQFDMDFEQRLDVTESEYLEMIRLKTAVLLASALKLGAILANASAEDAVCLYTFGIHIGLAFQIKDDLLDVYGSSDKFGKNIGDDIVTNKKTYLLIKALELATGDNKDALNHWVSTESFDPAEKIEAIKEIYGTLGIQSLAENLIDKHYEEAIKALEAVSVEDVRKAELKNLMTKLMNRER